MRDLEERIEFWSGRNVCGTEGSTVRHPFKSHVDIFNEKDVLEIGPGYGRQFREIRPIASKYSVADICQKVLNRQAYQDVDKFLITGHEQDLNKKFDVITFWYVIHHLLKTELGDFFSFLDRHLNPEGHLFFNTVSSQAGRRLDRSREDNGNGIETTPHNKEELLNIFSKYNLKVLHEKHIADNCYVFLVKKEDTD